MPRYYAEKIYKKEIPLGIDKRSKKKIVVNTPLSVALANRAFQLRCQCDSEALRANTFDSVSKAFLDARLSEMFSLADRNRKAKQSLQSFYQRSRF